MIRNKILKIYPDETPESPRDWDNVGTMACWHNRYNLGDIQPSDDPKESMKLLVEDQEPGFLDRLYEEEETFCDSVETWTTDSSREWDEIEQQRVEAAFDKYYISLPLYLYDHGGITMSTGAFRCPWDSGQVGFIYVSRQKAEKEYGVPEFPVVRHGVTFESFEDMAMYYLRSEVETYDQYLRGQVYGYVLEDLCGEEFDSCWGFYGRDWRTNGIADHIDEKELSKVQYMEPITVRDWDVCDEEEF